MMLLFGLFNARRGFKRAFLIRAVIGTVHDSSIYELLRLMLINVDRCVCISWCAILPAIFISNEIFDDRQSIEVTAESGARSVSLLAVRRLANHDFLSIDLREELKAHHKAVWTRHVVLFLSFCH